MLNPSQLRRDFPILQQTVNGRPLIYLDNAATMQLSEPVLQAVEAHYHSANGNVHRGVHTLSRRSTDALEEARRKTAQFLGAASPSELLFTAGTTDSINLAARLLAQNRIHPGDEILVTEMEHHSNLIPWQQLCLRSGAVLKVVPVLENGELDLNAFEALLSERTALLAVTWVSNVLGTVNPIAHLTEQAHRMGALVLIDGAQGVKLGTVDVQRLDCDFFAFSGHKLGSLTGIGALYCKEALLRSFAPVSFGGGMAEQVTLEQSSFAAAPLRFEAGTPNYVGAISLGAALDYLSGLGCTQIAAREHLLLAQLCQILEEFPEVQVLGAPELRSGAVSFTVQGVHPYDLGLLLDAQGVAVRTGQFCAQPLLRRFGLSGAVRLSPAFYNTEEELERFRRCLKEAIVRLRR